MLQLLSLLLFLSLSLSAIIAPGSEPLGSVKIVTKIDTNDPIIRFTMDQIGKLVLQTCDIELEEVISLKEQPTTGIQFEFVFNTVYGPLNVNAWTKFWEKNVTINKIQFESTSNLTSKSTSLVDFIKKALSRSDPESVSSQKITTTDNRKQLIGKLKYECGLLKNTKPLEKNSTKPTNKTTSTNKTISLTSLISGSSGNSTQSTNSTNSTSKADAETQPKTSQESPSNTATPSSPESNTTSISSIKSAASEAKNQKIVSIGSLIGSANLRTNQEKSPA